MSVAPSVSGSKRRSKSTFRKVLKTAKYETKDYLEPIVQAFKPNWQNEGYRTKVLEVDRSAPSVTQITLQPSKSWPGFKAGQHIGIDLNIKGSRQSRTFSLSSNPAFYAQTGKIQLSIKTQAEGLVTNWIAENLKAGDRVYISEAKGQFNWGEQVKSEAKNYVFIAGGIGITPIISNIEHMYAISSDITVNLWYSYRDNTEQSGPLFKDRIAALQAKNPNFTVEYINTSTTGRLQKSDYEAMLGSEKENVQLFICGPGSMVQEAANTAKAFGISQSQIAFEYFGLPEFANSDTPNSAYSVTFEKEGETIVYSGGEHNSILSAAEAAGLKPNFGCRAGVCHECVCKKIEGQTQNVITGELSGLGEELIQLCVSKPTTDIKLDKVKTKY